MSSFIGHHDQFLGPLHLGLLSLIPPLLVLFFLSLEPDYVFRFPLVIIYLLNDLLLFFPEQTNSIPQLENVLILLQPHSSGFLPGTEGTNCG